MPKSATEVAAKLLKTANDDLTELRLHIFEDGSDDEVALDEEAMDQLYKEFASNFSEVQGELIGVYGKPLRSGSNDDEVVPLNGVFDFSIWEVEGRFLYLAAAHEDSGLPVILMLGTSSG